MKPSKYSILIIPDNEDRDRQFSISRKQMLALFVGLIIMTLIVVFFMVYALPKLMQYQKMEEQNKQFATERVKVMELMQDIDRIEQMDKLIRKTLGSELQLPSNIEENASAQFQNNKSNNGVISYVNNIPSHYPVEGYVTQRISINKLYKNQNHYGIDIAVKEGEPIYASASGFVVYSGWTYDFGNYVILYHGDDYFTVYGHNNNNFVETRDFVKRGEVIAASGGTGISSGPHLHFEIWKNGKSVNPLELFPKYKDKDISVNNYE